MTSAKTIKHATLWAFTVCLVMVLVFFGAYTRGASIEDATMPIYTNIQLTFVVVNEESSTLLITGVKSRNCLLTGVNVETFNHGVWVKAQGHIVDQNGNKIEIPNQYIAVGSPFVRQFKIVPGGKAARIRLEARCHQFWMSQQTLPAVVAQVVQDNSK